MTFCYIRQLAPSASRLTWRRRLADMPQPLTQTLPLISSQFHRDVDSTGRFLKRSFWWWGRNINWRRKARNWSLFSEGNG